MFGVLSGLFLPWLSQCQQRQSAQTVANHVELSRCWGSVSSGLQVLEGLESSCVLSVLACCFFGRLFQPMSVLD